MTVQNYFQVLLLYEIVFQSSTCDRPHLGLKLSRAFVFCVSSFFFFLFVHSRNLRSVGSVAAVGKSTVGALMSCEVFFAHHDAVKLVQNLEVLLLTAIPPLWISRLPEASFTGTAPRESCSGRDRTALEYAR